MTAQTFNPELGIRVTPSAIQHIRDQLQRHPEACGLRLGVRKSGCSGYMYVVDLATEVGSEDQRFPVADGVEIVIDRQSLPVVNGTEIDFVKQGLNSSFRFNNPNTTGSCGCGESFSVTAEAVD